MRKSRQTAAPRAHRTNNIRRRARCRRSSGAQETASRYPIPIPWHSPSCLARSKTTNWRSQFCNRFKVLVNVASPWSGSTPLRPSAPRCTNGSDVRQARDLGGGQVHIERLRACALCIRAPTCGCRPLSWRRRPNRRPRSRCEDSDQTRHAPAIASALEPRSEKVAAKTRRSPKSAVSRHSSFATERFALSEPMRPYRGGRDPGSHHDRLGRSRHASVRRCRSGSASTGSIIPSPSSRADAETPRLSGGARGPAT